MKRYVGYGKHRLNATQKAAESPTENAKLVESCRFLFGDHFGTSDERKISINDGLHGIELGRKGGSLFLPPQKKMRLDSSELRRWNLQKLLRAYTTKVWDTLTDEELSKWVAEQHVLVHRKIRTSGDFGIVEFGSFAMGRRNRRRRDYLMAAQFDSQPYQRELFYGRVLLFLE